MTQQRSSGTIFNGNCTNLQYLFGLQRWLLQDVQFDAVQFRSDCRWNAKSLVVAALIWTWAAPSTLVERFQLSLGIIQRLFPKREINSISYQAFIKVLRRHSRNLLPPIIERLRGGSQNQIRALAQQSTPVLHHDDVQLGHPTDVGLASGTQQRFRN